MLNLFGEEDRELVPSPICCYEHPCPKKGFAFYGSVEKVSDVCENRSITCEKCGATGIESTNLKLKDDKE